MKKKKQLIAGIAIGVGAMTAGILFQRNVVCKLVPYTARMGIVECVAYMTGWNIPFCCDDFKFLYFHA